MIKNQHIDRVIIERESNYKYKYMLTQEYQINENEKNSFLNININPIVKIRMYQEEAISKMFIKDRVRSGIIVLPCGAGKTLVGIMAIAQMKRHSVIMCINNITVKQWEKQLLTFTNIDKSKIHKLISDEKVKTIPDLSTPCIVISTYSMLSKKDDLRSEYSRNYLNAIGSVDWGLLVLDEVQVAPAEVFKRAFLNKVRAHCKLGLTATLIRFIKKRR